MLILIMNLFIIENINKYLKFLNPCKRSNYYKAESLFLFNNNSNYLYSINYFNKTVMFFIVSFLLIN